MPPGRKLDRSRRALGPRPACPREPRALSHHGDERCDPYHWLRDRRRPEVRKLLEWHNAHARAAMEWSGGAALRDAVLGDMRARVKDEDASLPWRDRSYWYYTRHVPNADFPLYCRRPATDAARAFAEEVSALWARDPGAALPHYDDEIIFLDPNLLKRELRLGSVEIGDMHISPDERRVAVTVDCSNGREIFSVFVLDAIDVNYARWLGGQSGLHRAWMKAVATSKQSIYTASPSSCLPRSSPSFSPNSGSGTRRGPCAAAFPSSPAAAAAAAISKKTTNTSGTRASPLPPPPSSSSTPSSTTTTTAATTTAAAAAAHRIVRRIDVFDAGSEVLWLNDTALLYVGIDAKMRSCRVVHHDLTQPADSDAADTVCYEEMDEALWVSSLDFTADGKFLAFSVGSSDSTATFVMPCDEGRSHFVSRVPIVRQHMENEPKRKSETREVDHEESGEAADVETEEEEEEEEDPSDAPCRGCESAGEMEMSGQQRFTGGDSISSPGVKCFAAREEAVEYELDHHKSLLGEHVGAWIVTTNDSHRVNFGVDFVPDAEWRAGGFTRRPLFAYDARVKIDGVECAQSHLLVSVRRAGAATVLLLPTHVVRDRWTADPLHWTPLSLRADTVDLCVVFPSRSRFSLSKDAAVCWTWADLSAQSGILWNAADAVDKRRETDLSHAQDSHGHKENAEDNRKNEDDEEEDDFSTDWQLRGVSCHSADSSFDTRAWRLVATHLIIPAVTVSCTFSDGAETCADELQRRDKRERAAVTVSWLRDEAVGGAPYNASDYRATVLWVPSDYAFRTGAHAPIPLIDHSAGAPTLAGTETTTNEKDTAGKEAAEKDTAGKEAAEREMPCVLSDPPVLVPVYLCWRGAGRRPPADCCGLFLTVYGAYGECCDAEFDAERLALIDRKCVWAAAAVRGGGELGVPWRDAGRRLFRARAVNDFISVAAFLQSSENQQEETEEEEKGKKRSGVRIVASGASAGGFVVAAAMNAAPALFRAVVAAVPFVDCLTTLLDDKLPLTVSDWEEYGNPRDDPAAYWALRAVSPMDNIPQKIDGKAPPVLLQTAWNDTRVGYWESLAFAARLTDAGRTVLHHCDFGAGHGGAAGRYERLKDVAQEYAFALTMLRRPEL